LVYWIVSNVIQIGQQAVINKIIHRRRQAAPAPAPVLVKSGKGKKGKGK